MFSHFARNVTKNDMAILKLDIKLCTGQRLDDGAGQFNYLFALRCAALFWNTRYSRSGGLVSLLTGHKLQYLIIQRFVSVVKHYFKDYRTNCAALTI